MILDHRSVMAALLGLCLIASPGGAETPPSPPPPYGATKVQADAAGLMPLFPEGLAREFLTAAVHPSALPAVGTRTLAYKKATREWLTLPEAERLPDGEKSEWKETACEESMFYETRYGSPMVYARVLDVASKHGLTLARNPAAAPAVMDFGYGTIGHLLVMGAMGIEPTGIDIDPMLDKLYAPEQAAGRIPCLDSDNTVAINLLTGRWPAEQALADRLKTIRPQGFDLITSKNTLKNGYLHPTQPVEERKLVKLGVSDDAFVAALVSSLKPGGYLVIYNISPRPSRENEPYKPWADGRCPFPRSMLERAGLEVLAFDEVDDPKAEAIFGALSYPTTDANGEKDLFALYTVARRPAK